ncbi:MAG: acyl-CoA dehydrogenase family protein [Deltaproteobacteria bacterium]|nr:acyl-CoA dehydrogenase family protein [Deltaproteobacteria bacterium]
MDLTLPEEVQLLRDSVRAFARDVVAPSAAERDRTGAFPTEILRQAAALGLYGIKVPEEYGGTGASMLAYVTVMEEIAAACASTAVSLAVINLGADCVMRFGTDAQKKRFLTPLCRGDLQAAAFCLSEPHSGSDAAALQATARRDGNGYVLNGTKQWITNGAHAGFSVVFARTTPDGGAKGITAFVIPQGTPGFRVGKEEHKMGLRSSNTVQMIMEDCRVDDSLRLGAEGQGFEVAMAGLDGGRVGIAAQALGMGRAALQEGVRYAKERKAFGKTIADLGAVQDFIADTAMQLDAARLLVWRGATMLDRGLRITREAAMAKVFSTEAAGRAADRMLQVHGGYGYVNDFPIERIYRDVRVTRIYEGASEIQRVVIGRAVTAGG